jgi:DNA-binding CsgD family transcriptional regulator
MVEKNIKKRKRNSKIVKLAETGKYTVKELSKMFDLTDPAIRHIYKERTGSSISLKTKKGIRGGYMRKPFRNNQIVKLVKSGKKIVEMSELFGVTKQRIQQICKEAGISKWEQTRKAVASLKEKIKKAESEGKLEKFIDSMSEQQHKVMRNAKLRLNHKLTKERKARCVDMLNNGRTPIQIAKALGYTRDSVYAMLSSMGIKSKITPSQKRTRNATIKRMKKAGVPVVDIAEQFGLTTVMVYNILSGYVQKYNPDYYRKNKIKYSIQRNAKMFRA